MAQDLERILTEACGRLLYPSESDHPFDVFRWPATGRTARDEVRKRYPDATPVESQPVDEFFDELYDPDDPSFRRLQELLRTNLTDLEVIRAGDVRVEVFVVGRDISTAWVGLHTLSIET